MKEFIKEHPVVFGIFLLLGFITLINILTIGGEPVVEDFSDYNLEIFREALDKEVANGRDGICDFYILEDDNFAIWCMDSLSDGGQRIAMGRIAQNVEGKLQGQSAFMKISFYGWDSEERISVWEYDFLDK